MTEFIEHQTTVKKVVGSNLGRTTGLGVFV